MASLFIHTPFLWCDGILLYQGGYPFQRNALHGVLPVTLTAEMERGKGSSRATFAMEEEISKWCRNSAYTSEAQQYQGRSSNSF